MPLTLAFSPCPNDCFIFDAMVHERIDLEGLQFEVRLGDESSFDAWVHGEWVREQLFRSFDEGLRRSPALAREYLTTTRAQPLG